MSSRDIPRCLKDYDTEMFKLFELSHYAGVDIDPSLFRCLVELLKGVVLGFWCFLQFSEVSCHLMA